MARRPGNGNGGKSTRTGNGGAKPGNGKSTPSRKRQIEPYEHTDKQRINNPPVGLVTPETDPPLPTHRVYDYIDPVPSVRPGKNLDYDPHLDPQLVWAGKKEHSSFEVPTVSLHVHETIDPRTIVEAVRRRNGNGHPVQPSLFERPAERMPLRDAIEFYRHAHGWSNRLIAGDSLLVMNSLLEKEGMAGQVQMIYIDPPYGIKYGSNFQPFVNKRDVKDGKDEDLTQEPEMIRAFRDTWELGIHSYLTYLRDRLLLAKELLHESGSVFVQISEENLHHVREAIDDVFGKRNFAALIAFSKTTSTSTDILPAVADYLIWYAKDAAKLKFRKLFADLDVEEAVNGEFKFIELTDGTGRSLTADERARPKSIPEGRIFRTNTAVSPERSPNLTVEIDFGQGIRKYPGDNRHWKTSIAGMLRLKDLGRLALENSPTRMFKRYFDDFRLKELSNIWTDTRSEQRQVYVVQTVANVIQRCIVMTTDPGDLVFDPTCGSGTTAYVAEQWGRRWITCDTSRVAITLAKQRLMTADFDYYELAHPEEGVGSGFRYKTVPHVTLKSIANNPEIREGMTREQIDAAIARYADQETLYDQPFRDNSRVRVTGPFTVEAVPAPTVRSLEDINVGAGRSAKADPSAPFAEGATGLGMTKKADGQKSIGDFRHASTPLLDASVARKGPTLRHAEWRDELLKTGLRGKGGNHIDFSRVEPLAGTRWLHADAETKGAKPERVVFSFGPEYSLLEPNQVALAWEEARTLNPKPAIIVFAAFEFDPEAAKDIDSMTKEKTGMTFLTAQMNADLLTADLKKKRASNQGFWLVGRPDVDLRRASKEEAARVVHGFMSVTPASSRPVSGVGVPPAPALRVPNGSSQQVSGVDVVTPASSRQPSHSETPLYVVEVRGFDYYDTRTGAIESGDTSKIAMWLLDTDYDGRSLYPRQVFFPIAADDEGWAKLAKSLKAEIDADLIEKYRGTISLPFEIGANKRIAVKVIDDRGIESLKVVDVE